jgi:hypothetical protein
MKASNKVIMFDSSEAAQYRTGLSGWVSRNGMYYGNDERAARYDGCTHVACEDCGKPAPRGWLVCDACKEIREKATYDAMPKEVWNGKGMLYSESADKYFSDWGEIEDYCEEEDVKIDNLSLVICKPNYLPLLDLDYGCDDLAEDGELPDEIVEAIAKFNAVVKEVGAVSWLPSNKAAITQFEVKK